MTKKFQKNQNIKKKILQTQQIHLHSNCNSSSKEIIKKQFVHSEGAIVNISSSREQFTHSPFPPKTKHSLSTHTSLKKTLSPTRKNSKKNKVMSQENKENPLKSQQSFKKNRETSHQTPNSSLQSSKINPTTQKKDSSSPHSELTLSPPHSSSNYTEENIENSIIPENNTISFSQADEMWCIAVAPVHLRGLDAIGKIFGKSRKTVKLWCEAGAPIAYDGISYCSEYNLLFTWYLNHYRYYNNTQKTQDSK